MALFVYVDVLSWPATNPGEIVYTANQYYLRPDEYSVAVLQLTYGDDEGRYPWDKDCAVADLQPRPGTFRA